MQNITEQKKLFWQGYAHLENAHNEELVPMMEGVALQEITARKEKIIVADQELQEPRSGWARPRGREFSGFSFFEKI